MARVLVVDDDAGIRALLRSVVERHGQDVSVAGSAAEASPLIRAGVDLIFLDVDMPGKTGVELVFDLRKELGDTLPPVVFVTAYAERTSALQLSGSGAHAIIAKPFRFKEVEAVLDEVLGASIQTIQAT